MLHVSLEIEQACAFLYVAVCFVLLVTGNPAKCQICIEMNKKRELPSIFLRVFLSHLLLLLLTMLAGLLVFNYVFAPGIRLFVDRNPLVLIPVTLALFGAAGLLSLWTAGAVSVPLRRLAGMLQEGRSFQTPDERELGVEEIALLAGRIREAGLAGRPGDVSAGEARLNGSDASESDKAEHPERIGGSADGAAPDDTAGPDGSGTTVPDTATEPASIIVTVTPDYRITGIDLTAAQNREIDMSRFLGNHFLDVFETEERRLASHAALLRLLEQSRDPEEFETRTPLSGGRLLPMSWTAMNVFDDKGGITGKRLFGSVSGSG